MNRPRRSRRAFMSRDDGQVTAFVTVIAVALLALAGLVLDGGLALAAKIQALDAAQAAARVGAQQIDLATFRSTDTSRLDPARAAAAARGFLASAGLDGTASATATTVTVTVRTTSQTQLLGLVGVDSLDVSATATATPVRGVTGPGT